MRKRIKKASKNAFTGFGVAMDAQAHQKSVPKTKGLANL